ncbi:signal peptidase I [Halobacteria archaeon AArc-dxtr1]|nr:signal peptidase I [Halobacteria archaeon AArc-dxtr1]
MCECRIFDDAIREGVTMTEPNTTARTILHWAGILACIVALLSLLAGHVLGVPVLFSYVETGSMEPPIETGDGFVAIPSEVSGDVEAGDVVVFEAQEIEGGGLTTHRVVEETEHGYVTQGDANPSTDQEVGEPHVTDGQIVATAWQVNGEPVTIPHLGTAVMGIESGLESGQSWLASLFGTSALLGTQGLAYLLLAFGLGVVALSAVLDRGNATKRVRDRSRSRRDVFDARTLVIGMAVLLCIVTFATMFAMSGPTEVGIVSADFDSDRPDVIPAGETETQTRELQNGGVLPVVTVLEPTSEKIAVDDGGEATLDRGESVNATISVTAPDETGYYLRSLSEYRYFAVLPTSVVLSLHAIHPWVAMAAVTGTIVGLVALPFALLLGVGRIRTRTRRRTERASGFNW